MVCCFTAVAQTPAKPTGIFGKLLTDKTTHFSITIKPQSAAAFMLFSTRKSKNRYKIVFIYKQIRSLASGALDGKQGESFPNANSECKEKSQTGQDLSEKGL
jgi:hypothetical protein